MLISINLALRFLLELSALVAIGYWGFHTGKHPLVKVALGLGTPLVIAAIWSMFGAPKAPAKVAGPVRSLLELGVFVLAVASLLAADRPALAGVFGVLAVINTVLLYLWGQR